MMTLEEIRERLKSRRLGMVAEAVGVSRQYMYQIRNGKVTRPSYEIVRKIADYLNKT